MKTLVLTLWMTGAAWAEETTEAKEEPPAAEENLEKLPPAPMARCVFRPSATGRGKLCGGGWVQPVLPVF